MNNITKIIIIILLMFILLPIQAKAVFINDDLDIYGVEEKEVMPGELFTYAMKIDNVSSSNTELDIEIKYPDGWKILEVPNTIIIKSHSKKTIFVTFAVPENEKSGEYNVGIYINNHLLKELKVFVKSFYGVGIKLDKKYNYIIPGKKYNGLLYIKNTGNTEDVFNVRSIQNKNIKIDIEENYIQLLPGEVKELEYSLTVDKSVKFIKERVLFSATTNNIT
ncbi:MAG: hypothetical protein ACOCRK_09705, partial [bacterium]